MGYETEVTLMLSAAACLFAAAAIEKRKELRMSRKKRSCWIAERHKTRNTQNLIKDIQLLSSDNNYKNILVIDDFCFQSILSAIKSKIKKRDTIMRQSIPAEERLAITLRYLATGESFSAMAEESKLSRAFLSIAIMEVVETICTKLKAEYLKFPSKMEEWTNIAEDFSTQFQFPLCIGALGAQQIAIRPNKKDGALCYNNQKYFSIVLLALADAHSRFTFVNVQCNGRISNDNVLKRTSLMHILDNASEYLPDKKRIGEDRLLPHVFVADNTFSFSANLMTPYSSTPTNDLKESFNYRLNRARQSIERAFEILLTRFQILQGKIYLSDEKAQKIILCCCILHNFFIKNSSRYMDNFKLTENTDRLVEENSICGASTSDDRKQKEGEIYREAFLKYFSEEGKL